jgi:hypothetical protein
MDVVLQNYAPEQFSQLTDWKTKIHFPISLSCAVSVAHTIPYPVGTVNSHPDVKTARV